MTSITDVQKSKPSIDLPIQRVGITELKVPIFISEQDGSYQHTVADVDVFVDLAATSKGTHMSRLAIGVQKFIDQRLNSNLLSDIAEYIRNNEKLSDESEPLPDVGEDIDE